MAGAVSGQDIREQDFLFDKTYECPVCYEKIKERTVKSGKIRLLHSDMDLRPVYEQGEPLKYDVIVCPHCGYSVLSRFLKGLTSTQIKAVKAQVSILILLSFSMRIFYHAKGEMSRKKLTQKVILLILLKRP